MAGRTSDTPPAPPSTREVLSFFLRNPRAADSLEGVARWRLRQERIDNTVEQVNQALSWLVEQDFLVREAAAGVTPVFRLNRDRVGKAKRFMSRA